MERHALLLRDLLCLWSLKMLCKMWKRRTIKKVQKRSGWEGRLPKVCKNRELRLIKVAFFKKWPLSDWTFTWSCEKILVKENKLLNSCFYNELQNNGARLVEELRKIKIYPHPIPSHHVCQVPEQGDGETDCLPSSIKVCLRNKCSSTKKEFISLFNNLT